MTTTHAHHRHRSPSAVLRRIGRALTPHQRTGEATSDVRNKQVHASQVQFVRNFRM
ncbi:MAG: hypothetical protein LPK92_01005 [Actinomycetes bacterium]|nr:hypothetical protein [Actinomycetes bacterium]MDX5398292.1 hypothetical protein [Actinomycetes bacterium]MDX5449540.1 hypothetical protein [Actinomycetes bacterium]